MKTLAKLLYVEADEEVTDLVDRLRALNDEEAVTFVVPERARALQSPMSFRLLKRYADAYGKRVNVVSSDVRLQALSLESGFSAYPTLAAYDVGEEVHRPGENSDNMAAEDAGTSGAPVAVAPPPVVAPPPAVVSPSVVARSPVVVPPTSATRTADVVSGAPPRRKLAGAPPEPGGPKAPRDRRPFYIGGAAAALVALILGVLVAPSADVTVTVTGTPLHADVQLLGVPNAVLGSTDHFTTQVLSASESQTAQGTATGQKQIPAVTATGQVVFKNNLSSDVLFPKGIEVSTADGVRFRTQKATELITPGHSSAPVPISAESPGGSGNVAVNAITQISGGGSNLSVTNPQATAGGADQRVATVIQQSDIDAVMQALSGQLNPKVLNDLTTQASGKHMVAGPTPAVQSSSDHALGDEIGSFSTTMTVRATAVVFENAVVRKLLSDTLKRKVAYGSELTSSDQIKTTYDLASSTADGNVTLNGHADGFTVLIFSQPAMRGHIKGHSPSTARVFLQGLPNVVDVIIRQDPIGLPWLPFFSSRIAIHIQEVSGTATQ
jgi:hypothetical protein